MPAPSDDSLNTLQRYADRIRHDTIAMMAAADELDDEGDLEVPGVDREDLEDNAEDLRAVSLALLGIAAVMETDIAAAKARGGRRGPRGPCNVQKSIG